METQQAEVAEPETLDQRPEYYRVLKGGWFKGAGYKGPLGNLKGTLESTREN